MRTLIPSLALLVAAGNSMAVEEAVDLKEALTEGKTKASVTLRYETVDQDNTDGAGLFLDGTLGYTTKALNGLFLSVEFESVTGLTDSQEYNDRTANTNPAKSVILDPEGESINEAYLGYQGIENLMIKIGRQNIVLDNARFVGNVGWRLNAQTFDAASFKYTGIEKSEIFVAFVDDVKNITNANVNMDLGLMLNGSYKIDGIGKLTGYVYAYDFAEGEGGDNITYGLRLAGKYDTSESTALLYEAEFAQQSDYADTDDFSASYYHLVAGYKYKTLTAKIGYEVTGSDDGAGNFRHNFGTNHKFGGWADRFLGGSFPGRGLGVTDFYVNVAYKVPDMPLKGALFWHKFDSDEDSQDFGSEFDAVVTYKPGAVLFGAKAAIFSEGDDTEGSDISKVWLWANYKF